MLAVIVAEPFDDLLIPSNDCMLSLMTVNEVLAADKDPA